MALTIGIPKEIKTLEKRVGLTPAGAQALRQKGLDVLIQKGAGESSGFSDELYRQAGAMLVGSAAEIYARSGLIQKIKEPLPGEYDFFKPGLILFSFLHLAAPSSCDLVQALMKRRVTALAFETLEKDSRRPLLAPMSEIAGALASLYAAYFLGADLVSRSLSPLYDLKNDLAQIGAAYPSVPQLLFSPAAIVVFGGGIAGAAAAHYGLQIHGTVIIVEKNSLRCEELHKVFECAGNRFQVYTPETLPAAALKAADVWIGAVHQTGKRAPHVLDQKQMAAACCEKRKIIMDISIDQGGNFPEALPTSYEEPFYRDTGGNLRFCVPNIPSLAGPYASESMTKLCLPYTLALAQGLDKALQAYPELGSAINIQEGKVRLEAIREAHAL